MANGQIKNKLNKVAVSLKDNLQKFAPEIADGVASLLPENGLFGVAKNMLEKGSDLIDSKNKK